MLREFNERDDAALKERVGAGRKTHEGRYFEAFALEVEGELVGCLSIYQRTTSAVSLGVEIFSVQQGKGHGTRALLEGAALAREKGFRLVMNQVNTDNEASLAAHRKAGFECDGYIYRNQKDRDVAIWIKVL